MTNELYRRVRARRLSAGIGLVTAIFLLVVLAGLGVAIVSVVTSQQAASAQDQQGARAYQAARAGLEWALLVRLRGAELVPVVSMACPTAAGAGYTFALPPNTSLSSFSVTVTCTDPAANGGHYQLVSTACNEPGATGCPNAVKSADYTQRVLQAQL